MEKIVAGPFAIEIRPGRVLGVGMALESLFFQDRKKRDSRKPLDHDDPRAVMEIPRARSGRAHGAVQRGIFFYMRFLC